MGARSIRSVVVVVVVVACNSKDGASGRHGAAWRGAARRRSSDEATIGRKGVSGRGASGRGELLPGALHLRLALRSFGVTSTKKRMLLKRIRTEFERF